MYVYMAHSPCLLSVLMLHVCVSPLQAMIRMSMVHVSAHACVSVCYSMCVVLELCGLCSLMDGCMGGWMYS